MPRRWPLPPRPRRGARSPRDTGGGAAGVAIDAIVVIVGMGIVVDIVVDVDIADAVDIRPNQLPMNPNVVLTSILEK